MWADRWAAPAKLYDGVGLCAHQLCDLVPLLINQQTQKVVVDEGVVFPVVEASYVLHLVKLAV